MRFGLLHPFDGVIFDLDGTLLDSLGMWSQVDQDFLSKRGIPVPDDYMEALNPLGLQEAAVYTIRRFGLPETPEAVLAEWRGMVKAHYLEDIRPKPGARQLLAQLELMGVPMAVATALSEEMALPCLERCGLRQFFGAVVTANAPGMAKHLPAIWQKAAAAVSLPAERCVALDDTAPSILGAKAAGMQVVGIFDPLSSSREALEKAADAVVDGFGRLMAGIY